MKWLKSHAFAFRLTSFLLMVLVPILMYAAAQRGFDTALWLLLSTSALGASLMLAVK